MTEARGLGYTWNQGVRSTLLGAERAFFSRLQNPGILRSDAGSLTNRKKL